MKVILLEDIKGVGKKDEVINASDGYARNFLFPKNKAVEANNENMAKLKSRNESKAYKKQTELDEAKEIANKFERITVRIKVKAGGNGKIFGGVTAKEISEALKEEHSIDVDKKKIILPETIKQIGMTNVDVRLYEGVMAKLKVDVISE